MSDTEFSIDEEMPSTAEGEFDFDPDNIRINFSSDEAESKALEPIKEAGWYKVTVHDGEVRASKSEKNPGKPYWALTLKVQEGKHKGRNVWTKATGHYDPDRDGTSIKVPPLHEIIGKEFEAKVIYVPPKGGYNDKNEVKGFRGLNQNSDGEAVGASLMP
jgi:hypothetical protein